MFANYSGNWTDSIMHTLNLNITKDKQTLPIALQDLMLNTSNHIDKTTHLSDFITQFKNKQKLFSEQQRHIDMKFETTKKHFLFSSKLLKYSFLIASILKIIVLFLVLYILYKNTKLKTLITGFTLNQLQCKTQVIDILLPESIRLLRIFFVYVNYNCKC